MRTKSDMAYGFAALAERQMLLRNARERAIHEQPVAESGLRYRFITISRKDGSLGDTTALELSSRLRWRVYDKEIVHQIAQDSHVRQSLVEQLDERSQNLIHESLQRVLTMAAGASFGAEEYHKVLIKTLAYVAACGEAILVGRGANFVLREEGLGLHVRIVASPEVRVERLSRRWGVPAAEARQRMEQIDTERRNFIRHYYRQDIDDPRYYDIIFSTDYLSAGQVADCIMSMTGMPAPDRRVTGTSTDSTGVQTQGSLSL